MLDGQQSLAPRGVLALWCWASNLSGGDISTLRSTGFSKQKCKQRMLWATQHLLLLNHALPSVSSKAILY